jgi:tRNA A-37 threonylcarbamoyl transferase component Bud32
MSQPSLLWFLARYEEALRAGITPDAAWICRDHPQYLDAVRHALEQLGHLAPSPQAATLVGALPGALTGVAPTPAEATLAGSSRGPSRESPAPPSYQILDVLGRGGMGVVYKARQVSLDRVVALKMILAGGHAQGEEQARFLLEAETLAALQHPNIIQVYEYGTHEGLPFLAMELCPGGSLAQKLAGSPLPPREAAALVAQLARAVQAAHDAGVVHRDLKPANVLLARDGSPRITDFGLAKRIESDSNLTRTGALLGTPSYMAPEQAQASKHTGPPADIYALGAILYECLTGRPPFKGATAMETLQQVVSQEPVSIRNLQPKVARDLETICHKALRKEPERRYARAADLADDLVRFLKGEPVHARPVGPVERGWKWVRRRPLTTALLAGFALSLVTGTAVASRLAYLARQEAALANEREVEAREALDVAGRIALLIVSNALAPVEPREIVRDHDACLGLTPGEVTALGELAELPEAIDRVQLLGRVLDDPLATRKLSWRLKPVLRALLGLDEARRQAVLALVGPKVRAGGGDATVRLVCARIAALLRTPDAETRRAAATIILGALDGKLTAGERVLAAADLRPLAEEADPGMAAWLSGRIVALARGADPTLLERLTRACDAAERRLPQGQSREAELAGVLLGRMRQAMEDTTDLNTLWNYTRAFALVGGRLQQDAAAEGLRRVFAVASAKKQAATTEAAGEAFGAVAERLGADRASTMAVELATQALELVPGTSTTLLIGSLDAAMDETLPRVAKADVGRLAKPFGEAIENSQGAERLFVLSEAFERVAADLPAGERARLAERLTRRMLPLLRRKGEVEQGRLLAKWVAVTARFLSEAEARALLADSFVWRDIPLSLAQLEAAAVVGGAWAARLPAAEARRLGERVVGLLRQHTGWTAADLRHRARALAAVAKGLSAEQANALAEDLRRRIDALVGEAKTAEEMLHLADAFAAVAPLVPGGERQRLATRLVERVVEVVPLDSPLAELRELRRTVREAAQWADPAVLVKEAVRHAPAVIRLVSEQHWVLDVHKMLEAVTAPLPVAELVGLLGRPTCVGPAEEAVLAVLGKKVGRPFRSVWEVVAWQAEKGE